MAWKIDFSHSGIPLLIHEFFFRITLPFDSESDNIKYGSKFEIIKSSIELSVRQNGSHSTMSLGLSDGASQAHTAQQEKKLKLEFADVEVESLVASLTMKEHRQILKITPISLLLNLWQSKHPMTQEAIAPINDMVESFNSVSDILT